MFTFHRVGWFNGEEEKSGWLCLIETHEQLEAYIKHRSWDIAAAWIDIKEQGHCVTRLGECMKLLLQIKMEKEGVKSLGLVDAVNYMENTLNKTVIEIFIEEGEVYVNPAGGCRLTHLRDDHRGVDEEIFETCKNKDIVFPKLAENVVKVSKWFGGKHYYISVNGKNTDVDGVSKWSTVEAAEEARDKFLKQNRFKG